MLGVLVRAAIALVTIVFLGLGTGGCRARLMFAVDDAPAKTASADPRVPDPAQHHLHDRMARVEMKAVEADLDDDDDDPFCHVAHHAAPSSRRIQSPRHAHGCARDDVARDPSRFAVSARLARGPPA
jgi:hypothetical protein